MKPGDQVIYLPDPQLFGVGTIDHVRPDGRIVVTFSDGRDERFDPHELELFDFWAASQWGEEDERLPTPRTARCTCSHAGSDHSLLGACRERTYAGNPCPCTAYTPIAPLVPRPPGRPDLPWAGL